ncbi:MAG: hypothetical protein AAGG68_29655 [Bacteroidota bacterium]
MKEIILLLILTGLNYSVFCQDINYEAFKGEAVAVVMDIPLGKNNGFEWWNKPDLSEKGKTRILTIENRLVNADYAPSPTALLTKLYHAKSKKELLKYMTDKRFLKQFKVKKVKDYTQNHFRLEYQLVVPSSRGDVIILKYSEIAKGAKIGDYTIQAIYDRGWKITEVEELKDIEFIINSLNATSFQAIYQQYKGKDEDINRLREKVRTPMPDNRLNLTKLAQVLKEVQKSDPQLWKKLTE